MTAARSASISPQVDEATGREAKTFVLVMRYLRQPSPDTIRHAIVGLRLPGQSPRSEATLAKRHLTRLLERVDRFARPRTTFRIYRIRGTGAVTFYGAGALPNAEDTEFV